MVGLSMLLIVGFFVLAFILYYFLEKNKEDKQKGRKKPKAPRSYCAKPFFRKV